MFERPTCVSSAAKGGGVLFLSSALVLTVSAALASAPEKPALPAQPQAHSLVQVDEAAAAAHLKDMLQLARSKDPAEREQAALGLAEDRSQKADSPLLKLAADDDVLVQLQALSALSGRESLSVHKSLVKFALQSPFIRVRRAAASSLALADPDAARAAFLKKASGKTALRAAEALVWSQSILATMPREPGAKPRDAKAVAKEVKKLSKMHRSKASEERVAAVAAVLAITVHSGAPRADAVKDQLLEYIGDYHDAEEACAALDAMAVVPDPADLDVLMDLLEDDGLILVIERRLERALLATLRTLSTEDRAAELTKMLGGLKGDGQPRGPRLARIAAITGERALPQGERENILTALIKSKDIDTRAAAAKALLSIGDVGVTLALKEVSSDSVDERVAVQCIRVLHENGQLAPEPSEEKTEKEPEVEASEEDSEVPEGVAFLISLAEDHDSDLVQESAALALGQPGIHADAVAALAELAQSGDRIGLRNVATVALGRSRSPEGIAPLVEILGHDDWMMRATAAEGLKQISTRECVPALLAALKDKNMAVVATAEEALLTFSDRQGEAVDPETWPAWWEENGKRAHFRTLEEVKARKERYGYSITDAQIYRGLDVVVIPGHGDYIEGVLEQLGIKFRTVLAGKLSEAGLHPGAILMVGCTGELPDDDIEVVQWYVRSGGALFTSCWALTHTVARSYPAVIRKAGTPGEVLDTVFARPTTSALESPYLHGVFDGGVQPYYTLQGAHLIHVVDPERAEVILDSPYTAARYGSGDLAAYFRVGHGVILDTANHFEEQGFRSAQGLERPLDRQAFAVNHMGLKLEELRKIQGEKWWKSSTKTGAHVADRSVFRILTNFVREKRING